MGKQRKIDKGVSRLERGRFAIQPMAAGEVKATIEVSESDDNEIEIEKLDTDGLPREYEGKPIVWYCNFRVLKGGKPLQQKYRLKIPELRNLPKDSTVVIYDSREKVIPYDRSKIIGGDTLELTDGDPAVGHAP